MPYTHYGLLYVVACGGLWWAGMSYHVGVEGWAVMLLWCCEVKFVVWFFVCVVWCVVCGVVCDVWCVLARKVLQQSAVKFVLPIQSIPVPASYTV